MKIFSSDEISNVLADNLNMWSYKEGSLKREFKFKTFVEAFSFMTAVALESEKLNHHPDWFNSYNKISIALMTHDSNGITELDFDLASKIDKIFKKYTQNLQP